MPYDFKRYTDDIFVGVAVCILQTCIKNLKNETQTHKSVKRLLSCLGR